jgi:AcrR family transcriptional regulator
LIQAAYEVFSTRGYTNAGIADIAERLDIGQGTFYQYFESKRDILDHVVDYCVERIVTVIQDQDAPDSANSLEELADQLRAIVERLFDLLDSEPGLVQVLLFESTAVDDRLRYRLLELADAFGGTTASYLRHGIRKGFVRADLDTAVIARGINALTIPGSLLVLSGSADAEQRKRVIDALIDFVCAGVRVR